MQVIIWWGAAAILGGILGYILAAYKNRSTSSWAAWCIVLPPMVLVLLVLPRNPGPRPRQPSLDELDRETF